MRRRSVFISGGGIAGLSLAWWLAKDEHRITVADRVARFEARGHFISLKGSGAQLMQRMGLYDELAKHAIPATGSAYLDQAGHLLREHQFVDSAAALGGYLMLRRADLHQVLFNQTAPNVELRYGETARAIEQTGDGVIVRLHSGEEARFDLAVLAEGVHSELRSALFPESRETSLSGRYTVVIVAQPSPRIERVEAYFGQGLNINLLPAANDRLGLVVYQDDRFAPAPNKADAIAWRSYLLDLFHTFAPTVRGAISGIEAEDEVFSDVISMVPVEQLARGRIALLGDAGYCPTFFSGMGAAAAMQGAFCLSQQLRKTADDQAALATYADLMRPLALIYQASARRMRKAWLSRGARALMRNAFLKHASAQHMAKSARRFYHADITLDSLA